MNELDQNRIADEAWGKYLEGGTPESLGRVFDALSPILILLATRLVGPGRAHLEDAQDLLQATFLEAIRSRKRFERGRPVAPWLTTILVRCAADHRRRASRTSTIPLHDLEDTLSTDDGAGEESRELWHQVAESVLGLGPTYRAVIHLHLLQGLSAREISTALERPLSTVHSQLRRGLTMLKVRMPKNSLGAVLLAGHDPAPLQTARQLARGAVMQSAGASGVPAAAGAGSLLAAGLGPWALPTIGVLALLASTAITFYAAEGLKPSLEAMPGPQRAAAPQPSAARTASLPPVVPIPEAQEPGREPVPEAAPTAASPHLVCITGRCINQLGSPVRGGQVELVQGRDIEGPGATTNDLGRFSLEFEHPRDASLAGLQLRCNAPMHLERTFVLQGPEAGDVPMTLGGRIEAEIAAVDLAPHSRWTAVAKKVGASRSQLRLDFSSNRLLLQDPQTVAPGTWVFDMGRSHARSIHPSTIEVQPGQVTRVFIEPELYEAVSGHVRPSNEAETGATAWPQGRPYVQVIQRLADGSIQQCNRVLVGVDGSFTVYREPLGAERSPPEVQIAAQGFRPSSGRFSWGSAGLAVTLEAVSPDEGSGGSGGEEPPP